MILSNEDNLLLACTRISPDDKSVYKIKELAGYDLNWKYIVKNASHYGVAPLLYYNLKMADNTKIPPQAMNELKIMYHANAFHNILYYNALGKVLKVLKNIGIEVIVLKGAALAETVYRDIGLRPMGDVDILVKGTDLFAVDKELTKLGYFVIIPRTRWQAQKEKELCRYEGTPEWGCISSEGSFIEIHWDVNPAARFFGIEINELWSNAQPVKIAGIDTFMFSPHHLLLHVCVHSESHFRGGSSTQLIWSCDVAEIIKKYNREIDWESIVLEKTNMYLFRRLCIAKNWFNAPVPPEILERLKNNQTCEEVIHNFTAALNNQRGNSKKIVSPIHRHMSMLNRYDRFYDNIRYFIGLFFPGKEFLRRRYRIKRRGIVYLYYPFLFIKFIFKVTKALFQSVIYIYHKMAIFNKKQK